MKPNRIAFLSIFCAVAIWSSGCGGSQDHDHGEGADHSHEEEGGHSHGEEGGHAHDDDHAAIPPGVEVDPDDPTILPRPYTAERIRDAFVAGLKLEMRRTTQAGEAFERWTVEGWSENDAAIRYQPIDADGNVLEEGEVRVSSWHELRDHASFPATASTRAEVTRETALGSVAGWLYTVEDPAAGTVNEFFFAHDFPGAPLEFRAKRGDELVMEMIQVSRTLPE